MSNTNVTRYQRVSTDEQTTSLSLRKCLPFTVILVHSWTSQYLVRFVLLIVLVFCIVVVCFVCLRSVFGAPCCQCRRILHSYFPLRFSLTFLTGSISLHVDYQFRRDHPPSSQGVGTDKAYYICYYYLNLHSLIHVIITKTNILLRYAWMT